MKKMFQAAVVAAAVLAVPAMSLAAQTTPGGQADDHDGDGEADRRRQRGRYRPTAWSSRWTARPWC